MEQNDFYIEFWTTSVLLQSDTLMQDTMSVVVMKYKLQHRKNLELIANFGIIELLKRKRKAKNSHYLLENTCIFKDSWIETLMKKTSLYFLNNMSLKNNRNRT